MSSTYSDGKRNFKTAGDLALFLRKKHAQSYSKKKFTPWRTIAKEDFDGRVKAGTLCRIARDGYEPRTPAIRRALGLPEFVTVVACSKCGTRHDEIKTCPDKRKPRRRWVPPLLAAIQSAYRQMTPEEVNELQRRK